MLATGEGTTSGDSDQGHLDVAWEIAPLRAAALRTERAVNRRWETMRAAIIGGAVLLGVIGSAAALSLTGTTLPNGMGFLSAAGASTAEPDVTADEARDGVVGQGTAPPTNEPSAPSSDDGDLEGASTPTEGTPTTEQPEPARGTPTAEPQPAPVPDPEPTADPTPEPVPSSPAGGATEDEDDSGLIEDLLDLLLPGLLP